MRIILASASPRRKEILSTIFPKFDIICSEADESAEVEAPAQLVEELARLKAESVFARLGRPAEALVIGSDTVVAAEGEILGKPTDKADAQRMISMLSGRSHSVFTGVCLISEQLTEVFHEETRVHFRKLDDAEIEAYISTDEPYDKAGAYAIQGAAGAFVESIDGSFTNVMGLPAEGLKHRLIQLKII